jgi:hypothetical protein
MHQTGSSSSPALPTLRRDHSKDLLIDEDINAESDIISGFAPRGCFFEIPALVVDRLVCGQSAGALRGRKIDAGRVAEMGRNDTSDRSRSGLPWYRTAKSAGPCRQTRLKAGPSSSDSCWSNRWEVAD